MGFQVLFPALTNEMNGQRYSVPVQVYCNDLARRHANDESATTHLFGDDVSARDAINYFINWCGFNPWEVSRNYYLLDSSTSEPIDIFKQILSVCHCGINRIPQNIASYTLLDETIVNSVRTMTLTNSGYQNWDYYSSISWGQTGNNANLNFDFWIPPEDCFKSGKVVSVPDDCIYLWAHYEFKRESVLSPWLPFRITHRAQKVGNITVSGRSIFSSLINKDYEDLDAVIASADNDNPYAITPAQPGGGDGEGEWADVDGIKEIAFPDLPTLSPTNAGFITMYNPSNAQLTSLAAFLWSSAFDIDSFKKLFADPMDCIIGLGIIPVNPTLAGSKTVKFGDVDSGISMSYLSNQFVEKDFGSVEIKKYVGSFLDFPPYVKIDIYLPYIGMRELSADDVMGRTITLKYHIDCLTGGCAAMISVSGRGVLYQFNGNCIANVPLTAINYSGAIQNAVSAAGNVITTAVGAATGAAPIAAVGVAGLASNAANAAVNSKPTIQRTGSMGGAAGLMSVQQPYVIINRPRMCVPANLNKFIGNMVNINMKLQNCVGFTMVDMIILDSVPCTDNERAELYSILKEGVIF